MRSRAVRAMWLIGALAVLLVCYFAAWVVSARQMNAAFHRVNDAELRRERNPGLGALTLADIRALDRGCIEERVSFDDLARLGEPDLARDYEHQPGYHAYIYKPILAPVLPRTWTTNGAVFDAKDRLVFYTDFD